MHHYKRLLPEQIFRLREGAEIIAVIPPASKSSTNDKTAAHKTITKAIDSILFNSCEDLTFAEQKYQLEVICRVHEIERGDGVYQKFQMRLENLLRTQQHWYNQSSNVFDGAFLVNWRRPPFQFMWVLKR